MDSRDPKNVLLIGENSAMSDGIFKIAFQQAERGNIVLYLSSKPLTHLPDAFVTLDRSIQKKIIFMYFKSLEALIQKLLDFHNMSLTPALIIIESLHSFALQQNQPRNMDCYLQLHALLFAGLHSSVRCFGERSNNFCGSIVSLDDRENEFYEKNLTTFIDLFYFKKNYFKANEHTADWLNEFFDKTLK